MTYFSQEQKKVSYEVTEWSPSVCGDVIAVVATLCEAEQAARACYQAQITSPDWGSGYVTTFANGGAAANFFGGDVPEDANILALNLSDFGEAASI